MTSPPEHVSPELLVAQFGSGYARYDAGERTHHIELIESIHRTQDVALDVTQRSDGSWVVTVCASDQVGALSIIAGLFTCYRLDVVSADVFTLRLRGHRPEPPMASNRRRPSPRLRRPETYTPSRRILDIFEVRSLDGGTAWLWEGFRADLSALVTLLALGHEERAREQLADRVSEVFRTLGRDETKLFPISIDVANQPSSPFTEIMIRSVDTLGFLFAFTNALASLAVNIERAEIRTVAGEAQDTLWVTDLAGRPLTSEERIHQLRVATVLIKQFTHLLPRSPNPGQALNQFQALVAQMLSRQEWTAELRDLESAAVLETLARLMGVSRFLWEDFLRMQHENLFPVVVDMPALDRLRTREELGADLRQLLRGAPSPAERADALNSFKDREMFRIDLRHIAGRIGFREFSEELSSLAEVVVEAAAELCLESLRPDLGTPAPMGGHPCPWCICALGKFGGSELGFGSDIELMFIYRADGSTSGPTRLANSLYFEEFVRKFLAALRARQEGIFEIDLRLRPHGKAGALASSLEGFKRYYAADGDALQFERMALVRLRPVAGDPDLAARVVRARDAFVYSGEPLDLENVRHLRRRQATELVPLGMVSAKYSPGGLVDVEYFVQARQIAAGHADPRVRVTNTLDALERLADGGHIGPEEADRLRDSYRFLRRLIDALRVVRGHARDLTLPPAESREFAYLAHRLQYDSLAELQNAIAAQMGYARGLWESARLPGG